MRTNHTSTKTALLALAAIILPAMFAHAGGDTYSWENFQSDIAGVAEHVDRNLVNSWGWRHHPTASSG
jgi:hypothetical protein